ncbi:hypothetical protein [Novosphingobium soli]|uniref:Uncharacterized protein n=1 Tax=Novosphingobium soli TaxID=574956 RepID=A0ABV6CQ16_9SPHN
MSLRVANGIIVLEGRCAAEDAEELLIALQDHPEAPVDLARARKLHLAVLQVLLSLSPRVEALPAAGALSEDIRQMLIYKGDSAVESS